MSKHTPGPWGVGNTDPLLFGRKQGNGTEPIGFVYGPSFTERSEVGRRALADARLIASAPEMLAALEAAEALLVSMGMQSCDPYQQIVAAIAKAEGQA